jgi:hypothetical protein
MDQTRMPLRAKIYATAVTAAGALTLLSAAVLWTCPSAARFLGCLCLALLGSTFKVKLPGMDGSISPSFVPILFAAGTMSWQETVAMAAAAGILQTLWKPRKKPLAVQVLFNSANMVIALGAGFAVSHAVAPHPLLVQLAVAVTVFEVVNTFSVSIIVCLVGRSPFRSMWSNCHLWAFPYHLSGAALAAIWTQYDAGMSLTATILAAVTLYLLSVFYKELVTKATGSEAAS